MAPMALYLVSQQCPVSGNIYNVGMGCFNRAAIVTGPGIVVGDGREIPAPEQLLDQWENVTSLKDAKEYWNATEQIGDVLQAFTRAGRRCRRSAQGLETVETIFDAMPQAFVADAGRRRGCCLPVCHQRWWRRWTGIVRSRIAPARLKLGVHEKPGCTGWKMEAADFQSNMMNGVLPAMQAYTSGKLRSKAIS